MRTLLEYIKIIFSILFPFVGIGFIIISINLIIRDFRGIYIIYLFSGFVLLKYGFKIPYIYDDYIFDKEIKRRRQLEKDIKISGDLIQVPSDEIFINETVDDFIIEKATKFYDWFSGHIRGIDRSMDVKDYKIYSVLIYKTKINGKKYDFISLPVNRRKESIFFIISDRGYVDLYVDKTDKKIYYFDVEFLQIK